MFNLFKKKNGMVPLPVTEDDFDVWAGSLINSYGLPDTDDTRDALATSIMHLNQSVAFYPNEYFRDIILKSLANKVAYTKLQEYAVKRKHKAAMHKEAIDAVVEIMKTQEDVLTQLADTPAEITDVKPTPQM